MGTTRIVTLPVRTRPTTGPRFPGFTSLEDVPRHGVSVGPGSIMQRPRRVVMVLTASDERTSAHRILEARDFAPAWPATFIHHCPQASVVVLHSDAAATPPATGP